MSMVFRNATRAEFQRAVEWAGDEGWNPGMDDADVFWDFDPEGFVCAEMDGEMIASGSIVSYGDYGFMGFFIVRPDLRGRGIGGDFWHWRKSRLLERLGHLPTIGMDGVFDMQPFYAKGGFTFSHRNLRMQSTGRTACMDRHVRPLSEVPFEAVLEFDRGHFGCDRGRFLKRWIQLPHGLGLGFVEEETLTGMGVIRRCGNGFKIGPLFAETESVAEELFVALCNHAEGQPVFLDVPENNPGALELARRHAMSEVFGCARMYHGRPPTLPTRNIYGITTFELG